MKAPAGPTRRQALTGAIGELEAAGFEAPEAEARRLLAHALGVDTPELLLALDERLSPAEAGSVARALSRRLTREPLQHIEGESHFRGLVLKSDARALVPRPETEQLIDGIVGWAVGRQLGSALDIGTGSGAIAAVLVAEGIAPFVVATDRSAAALQLAAENLARLGLADRVELRRTAGPVWEPIRAAERFDLIVSNPPYVSDSELSELPPEVGDWEPREALAGGADGLDLIRDIAAKAAGHLSPGGALFLEIGSTQGPRVRRLFEEIAGWRRVLVQRDLAGRDRFVRAEPAA